MGLLSISLLGRIDIRYDGSPLSISDATRVQELFCYLLLNRDRPHPRELVASLLWGDYCTTTRSKRYLRKTLWQLNRYLDSLPEGTGKKLVHVESDWIRLDSPDYLWLDIAAFEETYTLAKGIQGRNLDHECAARIEQTLQLYRGDLLEGWYLDWCLCERERLQHHYLSMLDKMMGYCESTQRYESGLAYGERILQIDRARERTHQRMMRLYYLSENRTEALRQFERCANALKEDLDVGPARSTLALYQQIRTDNLAEVTTPSITESRPEGADADGLLGRLRQLHESLATLQHQVRQVLSDTEEALRKPAAPTMNRINPSDQPWVER